MAFELAALPEIFSAHDAHVSGMSGTALTRLVQHGDISRLGHGMYRRGPATGSLREITRAHRVVISHDSAAAWSDADLLFPPEGVHVTIPRGRKPGRQQLVIHRANLRPDEIVTIRGVEVTSPTRTVLDVARSLPVAEAVAIGDSLCRRGCLTADDVKDAATALPAGPGRPAALGVANLLDPRAESVFESVSRVTIVTAGLPAPRTQYNICTTEGVWLARVDFAWPELRLVLECDGFKFHGSREAFERDRRRWSALTSAGWRVVMVSWHDVIGNPAYLVNLLSAFVSTYNCATAPQSPA